MPCVQSLLCTYVVTGCYRAAVPQVSQQQSVQTKEDTAGNFTGQQISTVQSRRLTDKYAINVYTGMCASACTKQWKMAAKQRRQGGRQNKGKVRAGLQRTLRATGARVLDHNCAATQLSAKSLSTVYTSRQRSSDAVKT